MTIDAVDRNMKIVGGIVTPPDDEPNAFTLTDQTDVAVGTVITSDSITVEGMDSFGEAAISVDVGEYNSGSGWVSAPGVVGGGASVQVRHTTSASNSTATDQVLTIGSQNDTFTTTTIAAGGWQLPAGHYEPQKYALEIIQPQQGLTTTNRYYKAYPDPTGALGIEYNVRINVIGGSYPYYFELTGPTGMVIDSNTGVITWSTPTETGSPHSIAVDVYDQDQNRVTPVQVAWQLTVTTTGFLFIDAINGDTVANGATGTIGNPFKNISDWYGGADQAAESDTTHAGKFLYWRAGTYLSDVYSETPSATRPNQVAGMDNEKKPVVWLAYPGDAQPVFNFNDTFWTIFGCDNIYFDGIDFDVAGNAKGTAFNGSGLINDLVIRRCKFHDVTNGSAQNNSAFVSLGTSGTATQGQRFTFENNEFYSINYGFSVEGYSMDRVLFDNNISRDHSSHCVGPKEDCTMWFIRQNEFYDNLATTSTLWIYYGVNGDVEAADYEISYNLIKSNGGRPEINDTRAQNGGACYVFRNTFMDSCQQRDITSTCGPFSWNNNVIINDGSVDSGFDYVDQNISVQQNNFPANLTITDNLWGNDAAGITDADGILQGSFRTTYLGTRGHEISA